MDRYGHLMDGLDHQTVQRLDAIAAASRDPAVAPDALTVGRRRQITPLSRGLS